MLSNLEVMNVPLLRSKDRRGVKRCFGPIVERSRFFCRIVFLDLIFDGFKVVQGSILLVELGSQSFFEYGGEHSVTSN